MMKLGIVGLPNVGKSTLFNAISAAGAEVANYPFCTIEPNVGVVAVPDARVLKLREIFNSKKAVHATIEFRDIAGLVKGASKGEGLGNQFLGHIREVEALCHVVRCFEDENIAHVEGSIDPARDVDTINTELILSDIEVLERRISRLKTAMKGGSKAPAAELALTERFMAHLEDGKSARSLRLEDEEEALAASFGLLSYKPVIYVANLGEDSLSDAAAQDFGGNSYLKVLSGIAASEGSEMVAICAEIEAELTGLPDPEKEDFLTELGIGESGLDKLVKTSYSLLGLISFLTYGKDECRAWTIKAGTKALKAAGKIHSDFERGFIRAETIAYDKFMEAGGSIAAAKEKGLLRSEGKDYVVRDGDIITFLFNV